MKAHLLDCPCISNGERRLMALERLIECLENRAISSLERHSYCRFLIWLLWV